MKTLPEPEKTFGIKLIVNKAVPPNTLVVCGPDGLLGRDTRIFKFLPETKKS